MAPMNAFLTLTGMETLPLRMRQHNENAKEVKIRDILNGKEKMKKILEKLTVCS